MNLGIYIQVPFCRTKCTYCNFHTGVYSKSLYTPYCDSLVSEIRNWKSVYEAAGLAEATEAAQFVTDTVYIGGGTPSLLDPLELGRMIEAIRESFNCKIAEATLEADPETVTHAKADACLAAGINRISLGVQSFNDAELAAAGRLHRAADTVAAANTLRSAGFESISFDLIAGLAYQTSASWSDSLKQLVNLSPEHVSVYMLEVDEGSRLGREVLASGARYSASKLPADDQIADFYELARCELSRAGYNHYEISNWAKPGFESRHNLKYWRRHPYFGFGAGAHSFCSSRRWANLHDPARYLAAIQSGASAIDQTEILNSPQKLDEELFLGLRLNAGIDVPAIEARYNVTLRDRIAELERRGLLVMQGSNARLAADRISVSNEVFTELMS
ncbi:MAG TPA: radical SAM family heme chaperone HemW [Candidatus Acidoferrales bacterium]|nr:radical SAM family heme chaperone HemW [Candidatus Acidoferrales bacterium]